MFVAESKSCAKFFFGMVIVVARCVPGRGRGGRGTLNVYTYLHDLAAHYCNLTYTHHYAILSLEVIYEA